MIGSPWAAGRTGPCLLPQTDAHKRDQEEEVARTLPHDMGCGGVGGQRIGAPPVPWPAHGPSSPWLPRCVGSWAGEAGLGLGDHVQSPSLTGLSFLVCPGRLLAG